MTASASEWNSPPRASRHWRIVALLMMVVALGHFNRIGMSVAGTERIIPEFKSEMSQGEAEKKMGQVYSAFLLCYTLAMLPGGWFIDRFGARAALMVFAFGSSIFVALTGGMGWLCRDGWSLWIGLLVVRSLMGIVNAPLHPSTARMVYERVPSHMTTSANGLATFAACVGIASTYYGFGALMDRFHWPIAFGVTSGITLLVALIWSFGTRGSNSQTVGATAGAWPKPASMLRMLSRRSIVTITFSYAALGYFQYLFFYWIEYYFETIDKQSRDVARWYTTAITLAMGVGMALGGWLADRVPAEYSWRVRRGLVPALGMLGSGLVFELGLIATDSRITVGAFAIAAACIGMCEGGFWTTVVDLGGSQGGTAAGFMNTGGNAGGTLSPIVTPMLSALFAQHFGESLGWKLSLAVAGAVPVLGAILWLGVDNRTENER